MFEEHICQTTSLYQFVGVVVDLKVHEENKYVYRVGFDRSPKQTATPIFRPQQVRENYFPLHEAPRNDRPNLVGNREGGGWFISGNCSCRKRGRAISY